MPDPIQKTPVAILGDFHCLPQYGQLSYESPAAPRRKIVLLLGDGNVAIGVGAEIEKAKLDDVGRNGTELATDQAKVKDAFEKVAARIERHMKRFYLLSYCTPARKGEHEVRIVAKSKDPEGSGSLEYKFNAEGFGPPPDCDPNKPPAFDLKASAPVEEGSPKGSVEVKAGASVK